MPMTARYPTTCAQCSGRIMPGEEISKAASKWVHTGCATAASENDSLLPDLEPAGAAARPATRTARTTGKARRPDMAAPEGALEVWTDGACSGNPGPGGWAWATKDGRQDSGGEPKTTNQRMEVSAALNAILALEGPLVVVSDSTYVVNCFRDEWWRGWLARGWVNSQKKPVANRDLWEPLITAFKERGDISFRWVKGHSGDTMNDLVDRLAVEAGKNQSQQA
ncbi:ribonuclease HI [Kineosporia sp. J2-2]|uniref:ribonuclease H n=1 Tax=Kineosporia corallincola TaxID=2835133 RepID=A0ABS5TSH8_9ACTN|nr:ribonuclease H [Kineosporia corallincola]MBT0773772.1 ribonuclease HI [Kineosporia corallincola]